MRNPLLLLSAGAMLVSCRAQVPPVPQHVPALQPPPAMSAVLPPILSNPASPASPAVAGLTVMSRGPGGYELRNDRVRVVISDASGDVTFWGSSTGRNLLLRPGIVGRLTGQPATAPSGYFEPRDNQTWQFYGSDANHISWRKIYCLNGYSLMASYIYRNDNRATVGGAVQLTGNLVGVRVVQHAIDHFAGTSTFGDVSMTAYDENHRPCTQPIFPVLLQSDTRPCAPGEHQSFTTQWRLSPAVNAGP